MDKPLRSRGAGFPVLTPALLLALLVMIPACSSRKQDPSTSPSAARSARSGSALAIEQLHLLLTAVAVDMDGRPGPDGFGVRLYASNRRSSDAPAITQGRLEILMYDGSFTAAQLQGAEPLRVWSFDPGELKLRSQRTSIGMSYQFALAWGDQKPKHNLITIRARYSPGQGEPVLSGPGSIPISLR